MFTVPVRVSIVVNHLTCRLSLKLIMRQVAQPIARRVRNRHPFVALAHLPPTAHPHLHIHCPCLPKMHQKGTSGDSSHPNASLSDVLNSCHAGRTGCPPDEYSRHSADCLTHIKTLDCKMHRSYPYT